MGRQKRCASKLSPIFAGKHPNLVWAVAFSPDGRSVAAAHGAMGTNPTIVVYDVATGKVLRRLGRHQDTPFAIAWAHGGQVLASAGMDKTVLLYEGESTLSDMPISDED